MTDLLKSADSVLKLAVAAGAPLGFLFGDVVATSVSSRLGIAPADLGFDVTAYALLAAGFLVQALVLGFAGLAVGRIFLLVNNPFRRGDTTPSKADMRHPADPSPVPTANQNDHSPASPDSSVPLRHFLVLVSFSAAILPVALVRNEHRSVGDTFPMFLWAWGTVALAGIWRRTDRLAAFTLKGSESKKAVVGSLAALLLVGGSLWVARSDARSAVDNFRNGSTNRSFLIGLVLHPATMHVVGSVAIDANVCAVRVGAGAGVNVVVFKSSPNDVSQVIEISDAKAFRIGCS